MNPDLLAISHASAGLSLLDLFVIILGIVIVALLAHVTGVLIELIGRQRRNLRGVRK